ncbi:MAG: hypothetical protein H7Y02_06580 [Candidatus Obscuribacterales bacterium]|nr:hypothetical protein [Steroidobacteraceae bacterium]
MSNRTALSRAIVAALSVGYTSFAVANPTAGSPYFTDSQSSHVEDATSRGIGTVNMITCVMSAMQPDELVNTGDYIALVDENKCNAEKRSGAGNSSSGDGAQAASYMTSIVNSTRASNTDPMLTKVWISEEEQDQQMTIFVRTSASQAPSANNPFGVFRLDFCGKADSGPTTCMMNGFLDAQAGSLGFYQDEAGSGTTALQLTSVGTTTGSGKLSITENQGGMNVNQEFTFAYDQSLFLRGDQCFSRDAADPDTRFSVWRYGLYDAITGARVTRNSGFPIEYMSGGQTYHGYMGYWGLSLPPDAGSLASGATINKVDYGSGNAPTSTAFTLVKADGKLTKYTRQTTTLDKLDQIKITTFVGNDANNFFSGATPNSQYEVYWDNAAGNFKAVAQVNCGQNGCQTQSIEPEQAVAVTYFTPRGGLQGWSQSLGGEVFINLSGVTGPVQSTSVNVSYRVQDLVYPADMPAQLYCLNNCPTAAGLNAYFNQNTGTSPFGSSFNNWNSTAAANVVSYTTNAQSALLLDSAALPVAFTDSNALQQHPEFQHGVRSGRLFTSLAAAECSTGSGTYCDFKVNEASVYYVWETGANNWNQFAAVKDSSGTVVLFDAPLQVNYTVPTGAQYGQYAGKNIVLQYGGFGDLWGIPGQCVSRLTNQPVGCDTQDARYVPEFVIPMSDVTGVVTSGQTNFLVKWLDREIRFARKDLTVCSALVAPTNVTLPTAAGLRNPADPSSTFYIGVKPTVTTAPRVIHGDVKY